MLARQTSFSGPSLASLTFTTSAKFEDECGLIVVEKGVVKFYNTAFSMQFKLNKIRYHLRHRKTVIEITVDRKTFSFHTEQAETVYATIQKHLSDYQGITGAAVHKQSLDTDEIPEKLEASQEAGNNSAESIRTI